MERCTYPTCGCRDGDRCDQRGGLLFGIAKMLIMASLVLIAWMFHR